MNQSIAVRTYTTFYSVLGALLLLSGCAGPALRGDATELGKVGRATLQTTAGFYTAVETTASAMLEEELLGQALHLTLHDCAVTPPSDACKNGIGKIREQSNILPPKLAKWQAALQARSALVMRLSGLYDGISRLGENDLGASLAAKSDGLVQAVESVTANPISGAVGSLVKMALGELGTAVQNSQLRRGEAGIESAVAAYHRFFDAEFGAWQTMSTQLTESSSQNIVYLLQQNFASLGNAPEQRIASYGLESSTRKLTDNPSTNEALIGIQGMRNRRLSEATYGAANETKLALARLVTAHEAFPKAPGGLDSVLMAVTKARSYLDLIQQWKDEQAGKK